MLITEKNTHDAMIGMTRAGFVPRDENADIDIGEAFDRSLAEMRAAHMSTSRRNNLYDEYDQEIENIYQATGKRLDNPYANLPAGYDAGGLDWVAISAAEGGAPFKGETTAERVAVFHRQAEELQGGSPDFRPRSPDQIQADIVKRVTDIKAKAAEGVDSDFAWLGDLGGSAWGALSDPVNIAATVVTLPFGGWGGVGMAGLRGVAIGTLRTAAFEGAVNMLAETAIQPTVVDYHKELGLPYSWENAFNNILAAGVGGAVLGGAMHLGGRALKEAFHSLPLSARDTLDAWRAVRGAADGDAHHVSGAVAVLEDAVHVAERNPWHGPDGLAAHERIAEAAARDVDTGGADALRYLEKYRAHRREVLTDMAHSVDRQIRTQQVGDQIHVWHSRLDPGHYYAMLDVVPDLPDLAMAVRQIDSNGVRHALQNHSRDALPLKADDFRHVADILDRGELVSGGLGKDGKHLGFIWRTNIDGNWLHVVEVLRPGKKPTLDFQTAYWTAGPVRDFNSRISDGSSNAGAGWARDLENSINEGGNPEITPERSFHPSDASRPEVGRSDPQTHAHNVDDDLVSSKVSPPADVVNRLADDDAGVLQSARAAAAENLDIPTADGTAKAGDLLKRAENDHKTAELLRGCALGGE